ncbi:MAG: protein phosphatase 2C domain-containing protein [Gloeomargarita sp. SKYG116]|nr:protein phosphatase 2C domain-containing protein [Gloeomargarita sp. SKYG116]MDW8400122.1 protein phosphatase 2C domain-containing protein [Gloeomargarita sp. SKYGB_i_bin116]
MDNIECSNPSCYSLNPATEEFCQVCGAPLETIFLWVPGEPLPVTNWERPYQERYSWQGGNVLLDLQPGRPPLSVDSVPLEAQPYLRLFPWRLHLPQVYAVIPVGEQLRLLLSQAPLLAKEYGEKVSPRPQAQSFGMAWTAAPAFRQLNWLWQIARLWPVLGYQQVASSLLKPQLLRVEGPVLRLRELVVDKGRVTLAHLGQLLQRLVPSAKPGVREPLAQWCEAMIQQQITSAEDWLQRIEQTLAQFRDEWHSRVRVLAQTDPGPTRRRNEDACYPVSYQPHTDTLPLGIVCDGIGGHEGGDVAAQLAIEAVSQYLKPQVLMRLATKNILEELVAAVLHANDRLTHLNNQQQRQERQRMGTTLTLALARGYELFIVNVGDSRAYWITRRGCYQLTTDDDVASREVRLGYSLYPQAIHQPAAGALVQALGISASNVLHPTLQRLLLDEDSLLLLCSDGLSDNNLVDQYWRQELLPVLTGERDLATATRRLIELANRRNGHDNVTVVLLHYQVVAAPADGERVQESTPEPQLVQPSVAAIPPVEPVTQGRPRCVPVKKPLQLATSRPSWWWLGLLGGLLTVTAGAGLWWYERHPAPNPPSQAVTPTPPPFASTPVILKAPGQVNALAIDPQGRYLAVGSDDGSISLWQLPGDQPERRLRPPGIPVMGLAFVRQGKQLVSYDRSGLELWAVSSGRRLAPLTPPKGVVTAMATNPTGQFLAVGDANGTIYLWDLQLPKTRPTFTQNLPELGKIDALAVSPDGTLLAAGSQSQSVVEVWNIPQRQRRYTLTRPEWRQGVWSLAFRGDGQVLAGGSGVDGRVVLWDVAQGRWLRTLRAPGIVYDLLFSPDQAWLVTATGTVGDPAITVWNPANGATVVTLTGHQEAVRTIATTPDGRLLVSGGGDNQVLIWRAQE